MHICAIQALESWKRQAIALLAGTLTALALPPVIFFPICFFTFTAFVWLLDDIYKTRTRTICQRCRLAMLTGWSFGFGYFVAGLWWLGSAMLIDITTYGWTIPFAVLGLPAFLAFFYAFAAFAAFLLWQRGYGRIVALAFAFGLAEWLRSWMFTGFPWNAIGYTAMPSPLLMQPAALVGLYGMNALAVLVYATPALVSERKDRKTGFAIAIILIAADIGFGFYQLGNLPPTDRTVPESIRVRLVQPSIPQSEKIDDTARLLNFERHLQLTMAAPVNGAALPRLVIWPETSVPYVLEYAPAAQMRIGNALKDGQLALVGAIRVEQKENGTGGETNRPQYFNSLQVINNEGRTVVSVDKVHLVPFGEYLPLSPFFRKLGFKALAEVAGVYSAAARHITIPLANGPVILPLICYEAIFPAELDYEGPSPNVLVNITNDAWFGNTPGPWQHFAQARIRAVEQGMPLIRVANNGISAIIDPYGRIMTMISHNEIGFIDIDLPEKIVSIWHRNVMSITAFYIFMILFSCAMGLKLFRQG